MNTLDKKYLNLVRYILDNGIKKIDRTGTGTISIFDYTIRFDMSEGFPLLTSKKMFTKGVIHELIWFLKGDTNIKYLIDNDVHIWDGDAYKAYLSKYKDTNLSREEFIQKIKNDTIFCEKWGELGPIYGKQWRDWNGIDQIKNLIDDLKSNPDSRRLLVNAWNVGDLQQMTLPPCHFGFQCYTQEMTLVERKKYWCNLHNKSIHYADDLDMIDLDKFNVPKRKLSLKWMQRSVDLGLGWSFNVASYGLLLHLLAKEVNMIPYELIFSGGDIHIYLNHIEPLKKQLESNIYPLPKLVLNNNSLDDLKYEDIKILNYKSDALIKMLLSN